MELIRVWIDAAYHPKEEAAGLALVYHRKGQQFHQQAHVEGVSDNHIAELLACREALTYLSLLPESESWTLWLQSDSQLVVDTLEKGYVKRPIYQEVADKIFDLERHFQELIPQWVSQSENKYADQLAKQALHKESLPATFDNPEG